MKDGEHVDPLKLKYKWRKSKCFRGNLWNNQVFFIDKSLG